MDAGYFFFLLGFFSAGFPEAGFFPSGFPDATGFFQSAFTITVMPGFLPSDKTRFSCACNDRFFPLGFPFIYTERGFPISNGSPTRPRMID
jgi:hypothetical protein